MTVEFKMGFPPVGMNARLLTVNFVAKLLESPYIEIARCDPDGILIRAETQNELVSAFNHAIKTIGEEFNKKLENGEIQDFFMHINDRGTFQKLTGQTVAKGARFCETLAKVLQRVNLTWNELQKLGHMYIIEKPQEIILGGQELALPMEILHERYEAKYEFLKGRGGRKIKFRGSHAWLYVLLSGFALGYGGFYGNEILQVYLSENLLAEENLSILKILVAQGSVMDIITTLRTPPRPKIPYLLYVTCKVLRMLREKGLINEFLKGKAVLEMDRIMVGRAVSLVEKMVLDLTSLLEKLNRIEEKVGYRGRSLLSWISNKARKTIDLLRWGGPGYNAYAKLMTELYSVLQGSGDPLNLCYYALREVAEFEAAELEKRSSFQANVYLRREADTIRNLLEALIFVQ